MEEEKSFTEQSSQRKWYLIELLIRIYIINMRGREIWKL